MQVPAMFGEYDCRHVYLCPLPSLETPLAINDNEIYLSVCLYPKRRREGRRRVDNLCDRQSRVPRVHLGSLITARIIFSPLEHSVVCSQKKGKVSNRFPCRWQMYQIFFSWGGCNFAVFDFRRFMGSNNALPDFSLPAEIEISRLWKKCWNYCQKTSLNLKDKLLPHLRGLCALYVLTKATCHFTPFFLSF